MNVLEELRSLDPRDPGRWPLAFRAGAVVLAFFLVSLGLIYYFVWNDQRPRASNAPLPSLAREEDCSGLSAQQLGRGSRHVLGAVPQAAALHSRDLD